MTERDGVLLGIGAYVLWGLSALYWPLLDPAGTLEIIGMRSVWSLVVLLILVAATGRTRATLQLMRRPGTLAWLTFAAVLTAVNWGVFVLATTSGRVVDASMGYFINPLVLVLLGVLVLRERPRRQQWLAVGIGFAGVLVLVFGYGGPPWIALVLAGTFGLYGLIKKRLGVGALESMTIETAVLFVPSVIYCGWLQANGSATFGHISGQHTLLMLGASMVMMLPMLLFSAAANRIRLIVVGFLQFIEPIIQFLIGLLVFGEQMPMARWMAFTLIWIALAVVSWDAVRAGRGGSPALPVSPPPNHSAPGAERRPAGRT